VSSKVRRVDFHPDEYITGVGGVLTAEQQGIYWMICAVIMSEGGPMPFDEHRLAALCRTRPSRVRSVVEALIEKGKVTLTDVGELAQERALSEVERSTKRIQTAGENGAKGGRPTQKTEQNQQKSEPAGLSAEKLTTNHQPATEQDIAIARPKPSKKRHSYTDGFERYWAGYPTDSLMSKLDASKAFEALPPDEQEQAIISLPAFKAYCAARPDYRPVHANRYISQRRFEGFLKTQTAVDSRIFVAAGSTIWEALLRLRRVDTLPASERNGANGWYFDRDEVQRAKALAAEPDWRTAGAA
jgi:uncharacterized protein YdaU (DUF1376 family)